MGVKRQQGSGDQQDLFDHALQASQRHGATGEGGTGPGACAEPQAFTAFEPTAVHASPSFLTYSTSRSLISGEAPSSEWLETAVASASKTPDAVQFEGDLRHSLDNACSARPRTVGCKASMLVISPIRSCPGVSGNPIAFSAVAAGDILRNLRNT